jgi:hypothetical protein
LTSLSVKFLLQFLVTNSSILLNLREAAHNRTERFRLVPSGAASTSEKLNDSEAANQEFRRFGVFAFLDFGSAAPFSAAEIQGDRMRLV